jgi:hypothetical protein
MAAPDPESIRMAMDAAWRDHHHARDQTWRALQMVAVLGAGLVSIDVGYGNVAATTAAGVLVVLASLFGLWITKNHRSLERRKFIHIMNCEETLGLHRDDLIPLKRHHRGKTDQAPPEVRDAWVAIPEVFSFWQVFSWRKHNTSLFIMRLHLAILLFAVVFVVSRITLGTRVASAL